MRAVQLEQGVVLSSAREAEKRCAIIELTVQVWSVNQRATA
jgi:hypothetical protein